MVTDPAEGSDDVAEQTPVPSKYGGPQLTTVDYDLGGQTCHADQSANIGGATRDRAGQVG
ncbi:hypothetical protein GCM10028790_62510 [Micromonospora taraxaci]